MQSFLQYRRIKPDRPLSSDSHQENGSSRSSSDSPIYVEWTDPLDPSHPRNWSLKYKIWVLALVSMNVFALDWCSSADSQAAKEVAQEFGVPHLLESISSACYVFGIAIGALLAGPITESVGRNPIYIYGRLLHLFFIIGTALVQNVTSQIICRLLAGLGASTVLSIHGASVADVFGQEGRSLAWPYVAIWSFLGTSFAPVVGARIAEDPSISWRWTDWIAVIMASTTFIITILCLPETFTPIMLKWKAEKIRKITGDNRYIAQIESQSTFLERFKGVLTRAVTMVTKEYIVIFLGIWLILVYVVVFSFLTGMDFLFGDTYTSSPGIIGKSFLAIAVGAILNTLLATFYAHNHHKLLESQKKEKGVNQSLSPEYRMLAAFPVAVTLPVSLFWLGWTNSNSISYWSGLGAVALFGFSWAGIYVAVFHYIFDTYSIYAGSALAAITCVRYICAGGIQIISKEIWDKLGTQWTCTVVGCIATILTPIPYIIWHWGESLRRVSKFAGESFIVCQKDVPSMGKHV